MPRAARRRASSASVSRPRRWRSSSTRAAVAASGAGARGSGAPGVRRAASGNAESTHCCAHRPPWRPSSRVLTTSVRPVIAAPRITWVSSIGPPYAGPRGARSSQPGERAGVPASRRRRLLVAARQRVVQALARADAELGEHLAQVPLDRPRADEQLGADLRVGAPVPGQAGDLLLLGRKLVARVVAAPAHLLAGREQLAPGAV